MSRVEVIDNFSDPRWRLSNLYYCVDEDARKVPFIPNTAQQKFLDNMWYMNLILKSRQHGFTTLVDILALDQALFNNDWASGICAHTREDVEKIFEKKVKFPYDNLPEGIKNAKPADTDSAKKLKFSNGSSIEVGTSLRSGTYQFVHISEFGKLCAKWPEKAKEVVTGTLETVHRKNYVVIESTAEGKEGYFYKYCKEALDRQKQGRKPNEQQYKIQFFAWFDDIRNQIDPRMVVITKELREYFDGLSILGIDLSDEQKAWYAEKQNKLGDLIKQEHPSTPDEAFASSVEGTYFHTQMAIVRSRGQILRVPHVPNVPVNTGWDIGINDMATIWFHQRIGMEHRIINYIQDNGEGFEYYVEMMQKLGYLWGEHYLPHDADHRQFAVKGGKSVQNQIEDMGLRNTFIVPRTPSDISAIQESRSFIPLCFFDEENCAEGIKCIDNFKKEWDDRTGTFKNKYKHDWSSHGYKGFESLCRGLMLNQGLSAIGPLKTRSRAKSWRTA